MTHYLLGVLGCNPLLSVRTIQYQQALLKCKYVHALKRKRKKINAYIQKIKRNKKINIKSS